MARKMALKTKDPRCLNLWHVGFGTSNLSSLRPLQPQARDGCLATHTAVARTTNRLARKVHTSPKIRDTRQRVNGDTRHIVDRSHLFFGCIGARFGYTRLSCSPLSRGTSTPPSWRRTTASASGRYIWLDSFPRAWRTL